MITLVNQIVAVKAFVAVNVGDFLEVASATSIVNQIILLVNATFQSYLSIFALCFVLLTLEVGFELEFN